MHKSVFTSSTHAWLEDNLQPTHVFPSLTCVIGMSFTRHGFIFATSIILDGVNVLNCFMAMPIKLTSHERLLQTMQAGLEGPYSARIFFRLSSRTELTLVLFLYALVGGG